MTPDEEPEEVAGEIVVEDDGPPPKFSNREWPRPWMGVFLDSLAAMPVVGTAARQAGVGRTYVYDVRERVPEFAEAWREAAAMGAELLEHNVHRWATVGVPVKETRTKRDENGKVIEETVIETVNLSPMLAAVALKRHKPEYRESYHVEHSGQVASTEVERRPTRERMLELLAFASQLELPAADDEGEPGSSVDASANGHSPDE